MELTGNVPSQNTKEQLWAAIFNTEAWKQGIEAERYEQVGEGLYEMEVNADIGPIKGKQTAKIQFTDMHEPDSCDFKIEHSLVKSASGNFELKDPTEVTPDGENAVWPTETRTVLVYKLNADMGNPIFNAVLDGFKGKIKEGFEELLGRVEANAH
jgi:carbon monoxide dehydrogenase subunit G